VAEVKNYGLSGVHRTLQLGKQGPVLVGNADTDSFTVTLQDAATLTNMSGADATSGTHFITKSQLDSVYTEATFLANVNYNDTSPILLGNISYGTKTIITTFDVTTAFNANAVVTIGAASDNNLLMSDNYAEIEVVGTYQTINTVEFASNSALNIYVTQGGATQGAGTVLVSVVDGPVVNAGAVNYGAGSNYGNSNVVTLLSSFGSNSISTIGNISANAFVLPGGGTITENVYGFAGSIRLKPIGGSATQYLEIAPTGGGDGDHVHLMAGGGTTELFLGDDNQYVKLASNGAIVVNSANVSLGNSAQWTFGIDGNLTLPGNSFTVNYANGNQVSLGGGGIALSNLSVSVNSPSGNGSLTYSNTTGVFTFTPANLSSVAGNYSNSNVVTLLSSFGSNTILTTGNVTTGILTSTATIYGNPDIILGNTANASATKTRIVSVNEFSYIQTGNGTLGTTGNIVFAPYASTTQKVVIDTSSGNLTAAGTVTANNFSGNISITGNVTGTSPNVTLVAGAYSTTFDNTGNTTFANGTVSLTTLTATGNITGNFFIGNGSQLTGIVATAIQSGTANVRTFSSANVTISASGNANVLVVTGTGANISGTANVSGNLSAGNVSATTFTGALTGNVTGSATTAGTVTTAAQPNITSVGTLTSLGVTGNISAGNISTAGQVSASGNVSVGGNLTVTGNITGNVTTTFESTWTVPTGNSTQSFTVTANNTYYMWVDCNIPNGILVWNATGTVTNTNVPVVGYQYAWVYDGGGSPIDFTSIPNQFIGTANTIVRSSVAPSATTNRFDFGIRNTSGGNVTVRYGWAQIS